MPAPSSNSLPISSPEAAQPRPGDEGTVALYVHWPFCRSKCPYCDFNSHVREAVDDGAWAAALVAEIARSAALVPDRVLTSIFFGGGTPSLMAPATVARVIETATRLWRPALDLEITLEANPTSVEAGRLAAFAAAGINRASLGVQALDDAALRFLGRGHSAAEALAAVALARTVFPRLSFDLIYGRPGQEVAAWARELEQALGFAADHLSVYQLTIEEGTAFHAAARRGDWQMPDEDTQAALYETTNRVLEGAGLAAYEVSNHARPGAEARHNLTYWRYGDYIGVGPGAHGRLTLADGRAVATAAWRKPETWLDRVAAQGDGSESAVPLDPATRAAEALMMGLRLSEGVALARLEAVGAAPFDRLVDGAALARLIDGGFLVRTASHLRATARGRPVLNALLARLLP